MSERLKRIIEPALGFHIQLSKGVSRGEGREAYERKML